MTSPATNEIANLSTTLDASAGASTQVTEFDSGGVMLDVRCSNGRTFVLTFSPSLGYGVDEVSARDGLGNDYRFVYSTFHPAAVKLHELISRSSAASHALESR
jgi:hypothetical protein